jgi:hypothetical protein
VGIIGLSAEPSAAGLQSLEQLPAFRAHPDGFEVRALSATTLESARESAAKHGVRLYFGDYHELLKRPEVERFALRSLREARSMTTCATARWAAPCSPSWRPFARARPSSASSHGRACVNQLYPRSKRTDTGEEV